MVDLEAATFLDSTVIGALLAGQRKAKAAGLPFVLVVNTVTGPDVRRTFEMTGLLESFRVATSRDEAARLAQDARGSA